MPVVRTDNLDAGQVVIFDAYRTMTIFCGVDHSRIKDILLWSEDVGARWITEKWFSSRYSILVIDDREIERDEDKKVYKGLAYSKLWEDLPMQMMVNPKTEEVKWIPSKPPRCIDSTTLNNEMTLMLFHRAVSEATRKFESGEIKIPVYFYSDGFCPRYMLFCCGVVGCGSMIIFLGITLLAVLGLIP